MKLDEIVAVMAGSALFRRIDDRRLRLIALNGETLRFHDGEILFERGEEGEAAFLVLGGRAEVFVPGPSGPLVIASIGRGELFGEIAALCDRPRTAGVRAMGELVTLRLPSAALRRLLAEFDDLALTLIGVMAERLETANARIAASAVSPAAPGPEDASSP